MRRNQIIVLAGLLTLPVFFLIGVGVYHLWERDWFFTAWWPMAACLALAYLLAWRWGKQQRRGMHDEPPPMHWTERDRLAWKLVESRVKATEKVDSDKLQDPQFYFDTSMNLAEELAKVYHPESSQPLGNVTIPELLAVAELASQDLAKLTEDYFPGGHLLTINHLQQAHGAVKWYRRATNAWWAVSAVIDPVRTVARYAASKAGLSLPFDMLKQNAIGWLCAVYIQRLGHYLIELYSGRLKVGAGRYRELLAEHSAQPEPQADSETEVPTIAKAVTITLLGQVKAGKSSVVNAILGESSAKSDALPMTATITRYEREADGSRLILLDTPGYQQSGADASQKEATIEAAQQSDLLLLITHARNPGRQADADVLAHLREWFAARPHQRLPPIVVVMTHIDLLMPAMEWEPPYDWQNPKRVKETQIAAAVGVVREQLGQVEMVVPVCSAEGKMFGIAEGLIPELMELLGQARAVAMLRCLHAEAGEGQTRRVFDQLLRSGKAIVQTVLKK